MEKPLHGDSSPNNFGNISMSRGRGFDLLQFCTHFGKISWLTTPPKTKISPENQWLEDEITFPKRIHGTDIFAYINW